MRNWTQIDSCLNHGTVEEFKGTYRGNRGSRGAIHNKPRGRRKRPWRFLDKQRDQLPCRKMLIKLRELTISMMIIDIKDGDFGWERPRYGARVLDEAGGDRAVVEVAIPAAE